MCAITDDLLKRKVHADIVCILRRVDIRRPKLHKNHSPCSYVGKQNVIFNLKRSVGEKE